MYVQGPDALLELKRYVYHLGERFLIITGCGPITDQVVAKVKKSFDNPTASNLQPTNLKYGMAAPLAEVYDKENKPIKYEIHDFEGKQVTIENVDAVTEIAKKMDADVIIGIGGGKTLDLVRGVYFKKKCKVALCPTAAATNAPASTLAVIYNDNADLVAAWRMDYHPSLVLADTNLLIQAPPITVSAGIGDCMGTYYESLQLVKDLNRRSQIVDGAWNAQLDVKKVFFDNGFKAIMAAKNKQITLAYDSIIAQIVHTSGPASVTTGVGMPHIVDELLLFFPKCKKILHGLLVGYGVIPYLVWANFPLEELYEYIDFCISVGIPTTLEELGVADEPLESFAKAADLAAKGPTAGISPAKLTGEELYKSMFTANAIVKDYLGIE